MDKVRKKTDKQLKSMERKIDKVYSDNLALRRMIKKYDAYMKGVQKQTEALYKAYVNETDIELKQEYKKAYMDEIKALTLQSKEYKKLIDEFTTVMAQVNQEAVDIVNDQISEIYAENYNQVADECERVGIKVNGKEENVSG